MSPPAELLNNSSFNPLQSKRLKIIIDTDPGVDDALTILSAFNSANVDVIGITTLFGNVTTDQATRNALLLAELASRPDVPVAQGAAGPLTSMEPYQITAWVHGTDGLGNTSGSQREPAGRAHALDAARFIIDAASRHPGQLTLLCLASLTNLALALQLDPDLDLRLEGVTILGGAYGAMGNLNPAAEANFYGDPEAAEYVLSRCRCLRAVGLDVTERCVLTASDLASLKGKGRFGSFCHDITRFYHAFHRENAGLDGIYLHDPSALVSLLRPELFRWAQGPCVVVTQGPGKGHAIFDTGAKRWHAANAWTQRPPIRVATSCDTERVVAAVKDMVTRDAPM